MANKVFPAATFIRRLEELNYVKEPDIFHELFGHCPLLTNADFADNAAVLKRVKEERRKELIATGYNFVDQKRYHAYGDAVPTFTRTIGSKTVTLAPGSANYVLEVSPKVKSLNPNL